MIARVRKHLGTSGLAFRVWGRIDEQLMRRWGRGGERVTVRVRDHSPVITPFQPQFPMSTLLTAHSFRDQV